MRPRTLSPLTTTLPAILALVATLLLAGVTPAIAGSVSETFNTTTYRDAGNTTANWNTAAGELRLNPFTMTPLASLDTNSRLESVFVHGDLLLGGDELGGLYIFDVSEPTNPVTIGYLPVNAKDVEAAGDVAYVAFGTSGLFCVDISDPTAPVTIGTYNTPDQALGLRVDGNIVYVADRAGGLQVIDVSDPNAPALLGSLDTQRALDVAVSGNLACIADGVSGLVVVDITDPANPDSIGAYNNPAGAYDVTIDGDRVFLAGLGNGVYALDISDPTSPTLLDHFPTGNVVSGVAVAGDRLYVGDYTSGVKALDITDPTNLTPIGSYNTPSFSYGIAPAGDILYVADLFSGLQVVRIGYPVNPAQPGGQYDTPGQAVEVAVSGDLALVADFNSLELLDISDPESPILVSSYPVSVAAGVEVQGNLAYLSSYGFGMTVVDFSNPAVPVTIGSFNTPDFAVNIDVAGNLAFVADFNSGIQILDVSDPTLPSFVGSFNTPGLAHWVDVAGDHAFVADDLGGVQILDVSDPALPLLVGNIPLQTRHVEVFGDYLFITRSGGTIFSVYDITNPAAPVFAGAFNGAGSAAGLSIAGNLAIVANTSGSVQVVDISDPALPTLLTSQAVPGSASPGLAVAGQYAFLPRSTSGLRTMRIFRDDLDPTRNIGRSLPVDGQDEDILAVRLSSTETPGVTWEVSADGGANWQAILPDNAWNATLVPGNDLVWRSTHTLVSAQNPTVMDLNLDWLHAFGEIAAIDDVPGDQGGRVYLQFTRSFHDDAAETVSPVTQYGVYRRVDGAALAPELFAPASAGMPIAGDGFVPMEGVASARVDGTLYVKGEFAPAATGFPAGTWALVASVPATQSESYLVEVTTEADSSASGSNEAVYLVTTHTTTPSVWFASEPDSGYSVDNIAPGVPANFAAAYGPGTVDLSWDPAPEEDFQYFRVYRSTDPGFVPGPATLVHETAGTSWQDSPADPGSVYYKLTALDHAGNESDPAGSGAVTAVGDGIGAGRSFALGAAAPNPFRAGTRITFDLAADSEVSLDVFDVNGRRVRSLATGFLPAGSHEAAWDGTDDRGQAVAAGIYLYRLRAGADGSTRRVVLVR